MKSRVVAVGLGGVFALIGFAACGSDAGTGATPQSTVKLDKTTYVTQVPILTSTTTATLVPGETLVPGATAGEQLYVVKGGDALYSIARKHCLKAATDAQAVADYNAWSDGVEHPLFAGDEVKIPPGGCVPAVETQVTAVAGVTDVATTIANAVEPGTYTVQPGDYLGGIAAKLGTTVDALVAANGWASDQQVIIPGEKIKVPVKTG